MCHAGGRRASTSSSAVDDLLGAPSVIGRPGRISCSLAKAMFEPQKETEPTMAAKRQKMAT